MIIEDFTKGSYCAKIFAMDLYIQFINAYLSVLGTVLNLF